MQRRTKPCTEQGGLGWAGEDTAAAEVRGLTTGSTHLGLGMRIRGLLPRHSPHWPQLPTAST